MTQEKAENCVPSGNQTRQCKIAHHLVRDCPSDPPCLMPPKGTVSSCLLCQVTDKLCTRRSSHLHRPRLHRHHAESNKQPLASDRDAGESCMCSMDAKTQSDPVHVVYILHAM